MSDKTDKIAEKMGVHAPNSQVTINNLIVGQSSEISQGEKVSWQQVCLAMLEDRRPLTSNQLLPFEMQRDVIKDNVFVDLALVQQKKVDRRNEDVLPEQGSQLYEPSSYTETERFEFDRFLTDVLGAKKKEKLAIIGEPGSGKTTLLQRVAFWLLENSEDLVIWISLGELRDKDLRDYLTEDWLQQAMMYADPSIQADREKQFSQRSVWLLLDGLDEMTADARDALCLRGWVTQARVVVTCRLNVWQANPRILQGFETYRMLEFQLPQMEQFIQKWFHDDSISGRSLWLALNQTGKERIRDLARNPLRLTLLSSAWHLREGKLPDTKAELYKQFVDDLYEWKGNHFPTTSNQRKQLNAKLGELAIEAIDKELTRFRLRHSLVCKILGEPDDPASILQLVLGLGWLNTVGVDAANPRQPVYAFFHPTFQEYFAARAIDDWNFFLPREHEDKPVEDSGVCNPYRVFEPQWKEVILLWLGQDKEELKQQKIDFIDKLEEFKDGCRGFYGHQASFIAAAGIAEFRSHPKAKQIVERIALWGFGDFDDKRERWRTFLEPIEDSARKALLETECSGAINQICQILSKVEDEFIQYEIAHFLGELDRTNALAISNLIELLRTTKTEWLGVRIAASLIELGHTGPELEQALVSIVKVSQNELLRRDAARCLLQVNENHSEAISTLIDLFIKSKDETLRWSLDIEEIGKNRLDVMRALLRVFLTKKDVVHRRQAGTYIINILANEFNILEKFSSLLNFQKAFVSAFGKNHGQEEYNVSHLKKVIELINLALITKDQRVRRKSLWKLLEISVDYPELTKLLLELLKSRGDERRKTIIKMAHSLGLDQSEVVSIGIELLHSVEDDWLKYSIATGLKRVAPENTGAILALRNLLSVCSHENTRRWIADSLKDDNVDLEEVSEVFLDLIRSTQNWQISYWSAQGLGELSNKSLEIAKKLLDLLRENSGDEYGRIGESIVHGSKKVFDSRILSFFVARLKENLSEGTREKAFSLYANSYEIVWHCSSRIPYADFYALWHDSAPARVDSDGA